MCDVCKHFGIGPQPYEGDFQGCWILSHPCTVEERRLSAETGNLETSDSAALGEYETAASVPIWLLQTAKVGMLMGEQAFRAPPCLRGPSRATSLMADKQRGHRRQTCQLDGAPDSTRYYRAICPDGPRRTTEDLIHPSCLATYEFTKLSSHAARTQPQSFPSKDMFFRRGRCASAAMCLEQCTTRSCSSMEAESTGEHKMSNRMALGTVTVDPWKPSLPYMPEMPLSLAGSGRAL
ncbi:uncharacterized protein LOC111863799 isoform X1 [Cryptotermes secundus]|uniref:uncharacterized protein LOC111863799 isoform X1 n=1 Tax=Cryptotermes secundus TaxID=105785 RepID=UPI001454BF85|nr:uncharacterized protein LOC111863799 isoform X1 [Cryptotermes secundus]XP_033606874.1 uncharacterized protein LOC111863799 isoform X1 [Cryptotermes secundus]